VKRLLTVALLLKAHAAMAAPDAGKQPGPLKDASAAMPPGHPSVDGSDPHASGDPHAEGANGGDPHAGHGGGAGAGGLPETPQDSSVEDATLKAGTIVARAVNAEGKAIPKAEITLGILENSIAKGENRERVLRIADADGLVRFEGLKTGSGIAYRIMSLKDGATFSMMPFQLGDKGMRAELHVYQVTSDLSVASVVTQSAIYFELKDDRVQVEQAVMLYNFGKIAWKPKDDMIVSLPKGFKAVTSQQGMTDVGIDPVADQGVRLRGTFTPGQHQVVFRWQLDYEGEESLKIDVGAPPNMASSRVLASASNAMKLNVEGSPPAVDQTDEHGQRLLITEKRLTRSEKAVDHIMVAIEGIPTTGFKRDTVWMLTVFALLLVAGASFAGVRHVQKKTKLPKKANRDRLLEALRDLEAAHASGDVGPKTYEKSRRELIDDLALTFI
jgi:hypothetical protein